MADVRCPMCGQPNPDHLEECQFCQARLKPLTGGASGQEPRQEDDWLQSLRGEDDGGELPGWLEDFDDDLVAPEDEDSAPDLPPVSEDSGPEPEDNPAGEPDDLDIPDWLSSLGPVEEVSASDPNLPDWLTELSAPAPEKTEDELDRGASMEPVSGEPEELAGAEEFAGADPDEEEEEEFTFLVDEDGLPDWLAAVGSPSRGAEPAAEQPYSSRKDIPEEPPAAFSEESPAAGEENEAPPKEELPDLFAAEEEDAVPDWLSDLESEDEESGGDVPPPLPDWLSRLSDEEEPPPPAEAPGASEPPVDSGERVASEDVEPAVPSDDPELPPWLSEFEELVGDEDRSPQHDESQDAEADNAWLAGFLEEPEAEPAGDAGGVDWLSGFVDEDPVPGQADAEMQEEAAPELAAEDIGETAAADEVPDWLMAALEQGEKEEEEPSEVEEDSAAAAVPADAFSAPLPGAEEDLEPELEAWLSNFSIEEEPDEAAEEAESPDWLVEAAGTPAGEEVPEWLQDLQAHSLSDDLIESEEWPSDAGIEEVREEPEPGELEPAEEERTLAALIGSDTGEEDLSPGEIPDWLKAMQPAEPPPPAAEEAAAPTETGPVERVGPLAGLRGLLSAEPVAAQAGRPPAQFVRLQITDLQQRRAEELQKMVQAETAPRTPEREPGLTEQKVLRYLIAAVLFLVVLVPTLLPGRLSALPPRPAEMERLNPLIMGLTTDSTVLVVTDYQPGMSGEMDAAASAVVDHIMIQRPKLALVSTQATGPALGERLVRSVSITHGYAYGTEYVNLGYLAGDSTGLRSFAAAPQETLVVGYDSLSILRLFDDGPFFSPWSQPALQGVTGLADFDLTVLISDDPDAIRRWIEQVSPALRPGTLVVIASAQAAPMARPYLDVNRGPVVALVSGVPGGAAYEGFLQREGPARDAWDAFGLGSLIAVVLVLGAGSYNLYLAWRIRENARKGRS